MSPMRSRGRLRPAMAATAIRRAGSSSTRRRRSVLSASDPVRAGRDRWLISYADLVTLLFACFTSAYAAAQVAPPHAVLASANTSAVQPLAATQPEAPATTVDAATATPDKTEGASLRTSIEPLVVAAIGSRHVELVKDDRGLVISLPESAAFATGSATLTDEAMLFLATLAEALYSTTAALRVEGHTDNVPLAGGRYSTNWELSTARASAVVLFLIAQTAFPPERLSAAGYGEFRPRVANDTPEHRALNRRVDVVVIQHEAADAGDPRR